MIASVLARSAEGARHVYDKHQELGEPVLIVNADHVSSLPAFAGSVQATTRLATDMDGTATVRSLWYHLMELLPPDVAAANYAAYKAAHESGDVATQVREIFQSVRTLADAGFSREQMDQIARDVEMREGFWRLYATYGTDCAWVISHGLRDQIERVFHGEAGQLVPRVSALKLSWWSEALNREAPFDPQTVVVDGHKGLALAAAIGYWGVSREEVLVLTDSPNDREMRDPRSVVVSLYPMNDFDEKRVAWRGNDFNDAWSRSHAVLFDDSWESIALMRR